MATSVSSWTSSGACGSEGRLVFVCLHPTAAFQLEIMREICERFLFVSRGQAKAFADYAAFTTDADMRRYLGELAPRR